MAGQRAFSRTMLVTQRHIAIGITSKPTFDPGPSWTCWSGRANPVIIDDRDVEALALALIAVELQIPYAACPGLVTGTDASRPG